MGDKKSTIYFLIFAIIALIASSIVCFVIKKYEVELPVVIEEPADYAPEQTDEPTLEEIAEETGESVMPEPTNIPPLEETGEPIAPEPSNVPPLEEM